MRKDRAPPPRRTAKVDPALLIFKNFVVHLPEPIVRSGEFSALGGSLGVGMYLTQGKMPENKIQVFSEVLLHHIDNGMGAAAMRALVIAILYKGYRRIGGTPNMITLRDGHF
jgi:hypothetical protein